MLGKQSGKVCRCMDLSHIYGGRPLSRKVRAERWLEDHAEGMACMIGLIALGAAMWYLMLLWFQGCI